MSPADIMAHQAPPAPERLAAGWSDRIIADVAERHKLAVRDLFSRSRRHAIAHPRQEAWSLIWGTGRVSTTWIGRKFGRDHTTVVHGIKAHRERLAKAAAQ